MNGRDAIFFVCGVLGVILTIMIFPITRHVSKDTLEKIPTICEFDKITVDTNSNVTIFCSDSTKIVIRD